MSKQAKESNMFKIAQGEKIGNIICEHSQIVGDIVIVWDKNGEIQVFDVKSVKNKKAILYKINGAEIQEVILPKNHEILILKTATETSVRDYTNQVITDASLWKDFYVEPHSGSFFRQDQHGLWYNIEGNKLDALVFLQGDILVSLLGKKSLQSLSFRGQRIVMSPKSNFIQIGKLVLDQELKIVRFYGDKITGLGRRNIIFSNGKSVQEINLGLHESAFIDEEDGTPYLLNNEVVKKHVQSVKKGNRRFEVFKTSEETYVVNGKNNELLTCNERPVNIDFECYHQLGNRELALCCYDGQEHYMDVQTNSTFVLSEISADPITFLSPETVVVQGHRLRNMRLNNESFVYNETTKEIFTLNNGAISPDAIFDPVVFANYYGIIEVGNSRKYFYKDTKEIIQLSEDQIAVQEINGQFDQKLLNAKDTKGQPLVLDARNGFNALVKAFSNEQEIVAINGVPQNIGTQVLQNAALKTLGGTEKRVIDLNDENLDVFTLPKDLCAYPEDDRPSVFQGNPIMSLNFEEPIRIKDEVFFKGEFIPFHDRPHPIIIQEKNGLPLHLEGGGHRNELIVSFNIETLDKLSYLGRHRMIGANTLTEDHKEKELLFSIEKKKSWLAFNEHFLPIFKRATVLKDGIENAFVLYELRDTAGTPVYIVVEKAAPYGIWVETKRGLESIKMVERIDRSISLIEEPSLLKRMFGNQGGYFKEML